MDLSDSGVTLSLTLGGEALPWTELICNLEVLLDSLHLLYLPHLGSFVLGYSCLGSLLLGLLHCGLHRAALEECLEVTSAECGGFHKTVCY